MSGVELTPRQSSYIRKKTKHDEPDPSEVAGELNIVPFLDIVTNLIIFLLATSQAVLAVAELDAHLPTLSRSRSARPSTEAQETTLNLSVTVTQGGIIVAGSGGKLAPGCEVMQPGRVITVPRVGAEQDWAGLTRCMAQVHSRFPDEHQVILTADPDIEYLQIVNAMDAVRTNGTDPLFPDIMLSAGVR